MATFKVGQRVRIVQSPTPARIGCQATIILYRRVRRNDGRQGWGWELTVDGLGRIGDLGLPFAYFTDELAPLTDPNAERFIESLKKLAREPMPLTREKTQ